MSLAASAKWLVWKHSSREKVFEDSRTIGSSGSAPFSGDDSFVEPKTSEKSLQMRILDPSTIRVGTTLLPYIATAVVSTRAPGQRCFTRLITISLFIFSFPVGADWRR